MRERFMPIIQRNIFAEYTEAEEHLVEQDAEVGLYQCSIINQSILKAWGYHLYGD